MIGAAATSRRRRAPFLSVAVLVALVGSILSPVAAHAADDDAFPTAEDISQLREDIGDITVPEYVYRVDTRPWSEISANGGFSSQGTNTNLADHQTGMSLKPDAPTKSDWIATSSSRDEAFSFGNANFGDHEAYYLYEIKPGGQFHSVQESILTAMEGDRDLAVGWYGEGRANGYEAWDNLLTEREWAAQSRIESSSVTSWTKVEKVEGYFPQQLPVIVERNPGYRPPADSPTTQPYPIDELSQCTTRAVCHFTAPEDEDALEDLHGDRFSGDYDDFDFEVTLGDLAANEDALLAPLPETTDLLEELRGGMTADDFEAFGKGLTASFKSDTAALESVSADLDVLAAVGKAAGKTVELGSEVIPYLGIAATGYALKGDIEDGRWGDAAADAIAEGLQVAIVAQPEFAPILELALLADLVLQAIGDAVWGWVHPKPAISPEHRDDISKTFDGVDAAFDDVRSLWEQERSTAFEKFYTEHVLEEQADFLSQKLHSDLSVIHASSIATAEALQRQARVAIAKSRTHEQAKHVLADYVQHANTLQRHTADAMAVRAQTYDEKARTLFVLSSARTFSTDMSELRDRYFDEVVDDYLRQVDDVVFHVWWDQRAGNPWHRDLSPAEIAWTQDYLGSGTSSIEPTIADIDRNRPLATPALDEEEIVGAVTKSIAAATAADRKVPTAPPAPVIPEAPVEPPSGPEFRPSAKAIGEPGGQQLTAVGTGPAGWSIVRDRLSGAPLTTIAADGTWTLDLSGQSLGAFTIYWYAPGATEPSYRKMVPVGCGVTVPPTRPGCDPFFMDESWS